jgi:hypothetical protein
MRASIARLIHAEPDDMPSSQCFRRIVDRRAGLAPGADDNIVILDDEFPSYFTRAWPARSRGKTLDSIDQRTRLAAFQ